MRSEHVPARDPDIRVTANLLRDENSLGKFPCEIWLPSHVGDRPILRFTSTGQEYAGQSNAVLGEPFRLEATLIGFDDKPRQYIRSPKMWTHNISTLEYSKQEEPITTFIATPVRLAVVTPLQSQNQDSSNNTQIVFDLTDNVFLTPFQIIKSSYTGDVRVETIRQVSFQLEIGKVQFSRHYYTSKKEEQGNRGTTRYSKLVAELDVPIDPSESATIETKVLSPLNDLVLLSSFPARQRTVITGWRATNEDFLVEEFICYVDARQIQGDDRNQDLVIERLDFEEYIAVVHRCFSSMDSTSKELVRQAIYKALPDPRRPLETHFLSLFSALEGLTLIYRRAAMMEFSVKNKANWKKIERELRNVIVNFEIKDGSEINRDLLVKMLPMLKRVPFRDAFESFCRDKNIDISDLWPVFNVDEGISLNEIRNRLSHGDYFPDSKMGPLMYASANLEIVLERVLLSTLSWPINRTRISADALRTLGWLPNANLNREMLDLNSIS